MASIDLDKLLSGHVFAFIFVFCRLGTILMLFPGIGEQYVSARLRLMLAFSFSLVFTEPLMSRVPPLPASLADLFTLLSYEIIIGLFFGTFLRLMIGILETAGTVVGLQTGLSNATILNPALATQSPLPSAFLSSVGVVMLYVTGLDRMLIRCMVALYDVFPPGGELMPGDMAQSVMQLVGHTFLVGVEIAMPFFIIGLLMYIALGILQKLLPQVQLFLVVLPVQIWGGFTLLSVTIAGMLTVWLHYFDNALGPFFAR